MKCGCGKTMSHCAVTCHECKLERTHRVRLSRTLEDCCLKGNARIKYSYVRQIAAMVLNKEGRPKRCELCGFDIVVQIDHKKDISKFSKDATMAEVNSSDNLWYLCPNHHVMKGKGIIKP